MDEDVYGSKLTLWDKIRILQEWSPAVAYIQSFLATSDPHQKACVVADACEWAASKTRGTTVDDELVSHLSALLRSPQGESFLRWILAKVEGGAKA